VSTTETNGADVSGADASGAGDSSTDQGPASDEVSVFRRERSDLSRADQAVVIADAIGPFCGVGSIMFALVFVAQFIFDDTPGSLGSSLVAAMTSIMLGVTFLLLHGGRGAWIRERSLPFGIVVAGVVSLNPLVYIIGTEIAYPAVGMLLVIVGIGALLHDWFWAMVVILALDIAWVLCALAFGVPVPPAIFASQVIKANALAIVLNVARRRTVRRFEQARLEVHRLATTDALTGLSNQRGLMEVARELEGRKGVPAQDLAVVYVDVDGLKTVNDTHGHAAGDALIRSVADVLRRAFRPVDTIARVGGDEFAILLAGSDPDALVERVHERLGQAGVSASIGTAVAGPGSGPVDIDDLLDRADAAMYAVKTARKNRGQG